MPSTTPGTTPGFPSLQGAVWETTVVPRRRQAENQRPLGGAVRAEPGEPLPNHANHDPWHHPWFPFLTVGSLENQGGAADASRTRRTTAEPCPAPPLAPPLVSLPYRGQFGKPLWCHEGAWVILTTRLAEPIRVLGLWFRV